MIRRILHNILIAAEAMAQNKLRALLTSLGIVFGVASVIAMLAIGRGAQEKILQQLALLGADNLIITPHIENPEENKESEEEEDSADMQVKRYSPGLTLADAASIASTVPQVLAVYPEIVLPMEMAREGVSRNSVLVGVSRDHFYERADEFALGATFSVLHFDALAPVCIIGHEIRTRFFAGVDPIGKSIKCGPQWLRVVGVIKDQAVAQDQLEQLGLRNPNLDIYTPLPTVLLRYRDRSSVTEDDLTSDGGGDGSFNAANNNNQIDRIVVRLSDNSFSRSAAEIIGRMLTRRHNQMTDFEITIPEVVLEQQRETTRLFNYVLGAIASISLIVGGIGIMNIMLANVMERIKEIGIRLSLGATPNDINLQFLSEATAISVAGGAVGVLLGITLSILIAEAAEIDTIVTPSSVILSFGVAMSIGLVFGIVPARRAAAQNPVESLRHD